MAMLLLLSVLVSFVSHHGTSANSGCIISKGGLDKFYLSSKEPLQHGLENYLTELPPLYLSGRLMQVIIIGVPTVENPELTLVPSWGLRISVCKVLRVRYLTMSSVEVTVSINVCGKIRLRGGPHRLSIDDCSTDFGEMEAEDRWRLRVLLASVGRVQSPPFISLQLRPDVAPVAGETPQRDMVSSREVHKWQRVGRETGTSLCRGSLPWQAKGGADPREGRGGTEGRRATWITRHFKRSAMLQSLSSTSGWGSKYRACALLTDARVPLGGGRPSNG
ncbi:uncharacterized protein PHA67_015789 [Liasis olivaceus]